MDGDDKGTRWRRDVLKSDITKVVVFAYTGVYLFADTTSGPDVARVRICGMKAEFFQSLDQIASVWMSAMGLIAI